MTHVLILRNPSVRRTARHVDELYVKVPVEAFAEFLETVKAGRA